MSFVSVAKTKRGNHVWRDESGAGPLLYVSGMAVDGDGSPHCYHPENKGLDALGNAHEGDRWFGVVTKDNKPVVQGAGDPAPGYYVSPTTLSDPGIKDPTNPRRYVDSETIPYIAFPSRLFAEGGGDVSRLGLGVNLGDYVIVYDIKSGMASGAFFADVGPAYKLGEASIAVARALNIPSSPRNGGVDSPTRIAYVVFPKSFTSFQSSPYPQSAELIKTRARQLFDAWGAEEGGGEAMLEKKLAAIKLRSVSFGAGSNKEELALDIPKPGDRRDDPETHYREEPAPKSAD